MSLTSRRTVTARKRHNPEEIKARARERTVETRLPELRLQGDIGAATRIARACRGTPERVGRGAGEPVARAEPGTLQTVTSEWTSCNARSANARPADMRRMPRETAASDWMSGNMCAADVRPANMRRPEGMHPTAAASPEAYSAAVPAKPAAMSPTAMSPTAMSPAAMSPAATMPAATAAAGVCFECEKRHDDEHNRGHASARHQHQLHGAAGLGAPRRRGRLSLGVSPRTKSF
jgi:hypothetical protein